MSFQAIVRKQYQDKVHQAFQQLGRLSQPQAVGWIKIVRQALGLTGSELAKRMQVTKGRISQLESAESQGGLTLKTMQKVAHALNGRFVYAIVPNQDVGDMLKDRTIQKTKTEIQAALMHMAEATKALTLTQAGQQSPGTKPLSDPELQRLAKEIMQRLPKELWHHD